MSIIKFWLALVALLLGAFAATAPANASQFDPFCHKAGSPQILAAKIRASLAKDPTGRTSIGGKGCLATPEAYLDMMAKRDAATVDARNPKTGGPITTGYDVANYFDSLVPGPPRPGVYKTAAIQVLGKNNILGIWNALARPYKPGEKAWVDPVTGEAVFFEDCSNPIGRIIVENPCVILDVDMNEGEHLLGFRKEVASPTDKCGPLLKRPDSSVYESLKLQECDHGDCTDVQPVRFLEQRLRAKGDNRKVVPIASQSFSVKARTSGRHLIRLSPGELTSGGLFILCLHDPKTGRTSLTEYIFGGNGRIGKNSYRERHAYVSHADNKVAIRGFIADGGVERIWTDSVTRKPM